MRGISESRKLWASHKYKVLSKSHKSYLEIREYLKSDAPDYACLQEKIAFALEREESPKDCINAYQHVWGYFKKQASAKEKEEFLVLLEDYRNGRKQEESLRNYVRALLVKYPNEYLSESSLIGGGGL